jgi:hypothetical protein
MPRSYSVFELQTSACTSESSGVGNYELNTTTSLTWKHDWTNSLRSEGGDEHIEPHYGDSTRSDRANTYSLAMEYTVLRWLTMGVDMAGLTRAPMTRPPSTSAM